MLEGLEITIKSSKEFGINNPTLRLDSEFFKKEYLELYKTLFKKPCNKLEILTDWVTQGPNPIFQEDEGIPCLTGRNINNGRVSYENADNLSEDEYSNWKRFQIKYGDTLITLKGKGSIGKIGYVTDGRKAIFSRNIGIIRPNKINAGYVNAFILSKYGAKIIARGETGGTGQSTLTTAYLKNIDIPRIGIEKEIGSIVELSEGVLNESQKAYKAAESLLATILGLNNFEPSTDSVNVKSFKESFLATGRLDAEYYQKKYEDYAEIIKTNTLGFTLISNEYSLIKGVSKKDKESFNYIEIGDINVSDGSSSCNLIETCELPANAKIEAEKGDLLISKVRPNRGAVSVVDFDAKNLIVSGAFTVLREKKTSVFSNETLKVLLRTEVYKDWLLQFNIGTQYPVIRDEDVINMPIPKIPRELQDKITKEIQSSQVLKKQSEQLLETAKRAVELAIEQDEDAAIRYIEEAGN